MEVVSATCAMVGLAVPVFRCAKALRDKTKLVRHLLHPPRTPTVIIYPCSQVASEKAEHLAATHRMRNGYQPPQITPQQQQGTIRSTEPRNRPEGAHRVCVAPLPVRGRGLTMAQNRTRPLRMARFDQYEPVKEESTGS